MARPRHKALPADEATTVAGRAAPRDWDRLRLRFEQELLASQDAGASLDSALRVPVRGESER